MNWKRVAAVVAAIGLFSVAEAQAQVAWDSPLLTPPRASSGLGLFLTDPSRGDVGVLATWHGSGTLGYRIGIANDFRGDLSVFGGIDATGRILRVSDEVPVDLSWVFGAGLGIANNVLVSFPLGVSVGRTFVADDVRLTPYLTPRIALDAYFGDGSDLDLDFSADLGLDLAFHSSWLIRFGATFGDRSALAIGIVF